MFRHLFFNGFHPVLPWVAFLIVGMWLGRQDLRDLTVRQRLLRRALAVAIGAESISWLLTRWTAPLGDDIHLLFDSAPLPPMPLYLVAGSATAIVVILLSITVAQRWSTAPWLPPLVHTGQLALTLYVAHVIVGMGTLEILGYLTEGSTLTFALGASAVFCATALAFAHLWRQRFARGPLEALMRRFSR